MRWLLAMVLAAGLPAQDPPPEPKFEATAYTFGTTVVSTTGLEGRIYNLGAGTDRLPRLEKMKPAGTIYTNALNVWPQEFDEGFPGITKRFEWFAIDYTGKFWIEKTGRYRFSLLSDDGSKLDIDGAEVIDNDGRHVPTAYSGSAQLTRGVHRIRVQYFQGPRFTVALVLAIAEEKGPWKIFRTEDFLPPQDPSLWVPGKISRIAHSQTPDDRASGRW